MDQHAFGVLKDVLAAPGLWAFAIAAGHLGLEDAVAACRTRELPEAVLAEMRKVGYGLTHLPPADAIERVRLGVRLEAERERRAARGEAREPGDVARALGVDPREAARAFEQLRVFGWNPRPQPARRVGRRKVKDGDGGRDPGAAPAA